MLILAQLSLLFEMIISKCVFTVPEDYKIPIVPKDPTPFIRNVTACPYYKDSPVCCNTVQDIQMQRNFQAIDAAFGSSGGGCDMYQICANNLKRFWCDYTCSPNQDDFVEEFGEEFVPDPLDADHKLTLCQMITVTVESDSACNLFGSCKRTSFASQVSAMQNTGGFFNFQGENAVSQALQLIKVKFTTDVTKSLRLPELPPCNYNATNYTLDQDTKIYTDPFGFQLYQNCSCNNCENSCSSNAILYTPTGVFEGFNTVLVFSVWGSVLFVVILITTARFLLKKKKASEYSRVLQSEQPLLGNA